MASFNPQTGYGYPNNGAPGGGGSAPMYPSQPTMAHNPGAGVFQPQGRFNPATSGGGAAPFNPTQPTQPLQPMAQPMAQPIAQPMSRQAGLGGAFQPQGGVQPTAAGSTAASMQAALGAVPIPSVQNLAANPIAGIGLQYGGQAIDSGKAYVTNKMNKYISVDSLRFYFDVNTSYVIKKLRTLLFPFRVKEWGRKTMQDPASGGVSYVSPREDIASPDLYIPVMALVTYTLIVGFTQGVAGSFSPDVLTSCTTSLAVALGMEVGLTKLGLSFLPSTRNLPWMDLMAYAGYKYVGVTLSVVVGQILGRGAFYLSIIYCAVAMALVMVKTLKLVATSSSAGSLDGGMSSAPSKQDRPRNYFLLSVAVAQLVIMYGVSVAPELPAAIVNSQL